jgi:3-(methylthio)propanoyl-CoA dehydrogenase
VPQRSAFRLIDAYGTDAMRSEWLPRLASGEWGATVCVSEVGAGSDLARATTRAVQNEDGTWSVTGEKSWISYGDHDLTDQIGHAVLAQVIDAEGRKRPSLFLVPASLPDGSVNRVAVRRIEHKLGLHGSPTCALGFEGATGWLLGEPGRGLAQLFVMIANMRLAVGAMGLGIASAAADVALAYAAERKQGGKPNPVPINQHADVRLQLLDAMAAPTLLRGLLFAVANANDLAMQGDAEAGALAAWLLPIVKTTGGEMAFDTAGTAIQVLGGAGYINEWLVEQALHDARVLTIFEGATGIQALDLTHAACWPTTAAILHFSALPKVATMIGSVSASANWGRPQAGSRSIRRRPMAARLRSSIWRQLPR